MKQSQQLYFATRNPQEDIPIISETSSNFISQLTQRKGALSLVTPLPLSLANIH